SVTFNPTTAETWGNITAEYILGITNETGNITIVPGSTATVIIAETPNGTPVDIQTWTTDNNSVAYYASGYDEDDNYVGLVPGVWSWSPANDTIGTILGSPGTDITIDYTTPGVGVLRFDGGSALQTTTGNISVSVGSIAYVRITSIPGDAVVDTESWDTDDNSVAYYASGYDADGNYVGLVPGDWSWSPVNDTVGVISGSPDTTITIDYTTPGIGVLRFDNGTLQAETGEITVSVGSVAYVRITSIHGGPEVGAEARNADENAIAYYASGYDADGNYVGLVHGVWSWDMGSDDVGAIIGSPDTRAIIDYTTPGMAVLAFDGGGFQDTTGAITVTAGAAYRVVVTPTYRVISPGETQDFNAIAYDREGNIADQNQANFAWAVESAAGSMDADGLFTASNVEGTYTIWANHTSTISGTAEVVIVISGAIVYEPDFILVAEDTATPPTWAGNRTMTTDQAVTLYAFAYNATKAVNEGSGWWQLTATWSRTGTLQSVSATATTFNFNPTAPGTGAIRITHNLLANDTGTITVSVGAL
ncbi:MAG: hypothetical protein QCI38_08305, partial [Candidatus Thermoplasmatota archaeon]|nr:hypothetical protein [Candidatus Thermoplasmatota archaeon]